ncbi:P-loop containing nucleoside triphosphate hydrolase protein [Cunninghamella echinulata]|nr:P-loop containing nucleoside triphosphate hydrolase protein [Cunninghamella echinulata]
MYLFQRLYYSKSLVTQITKSEFSTTSALLSKRSQLRKPNISTLTKHLKPDGLTGKQRRDVLREKLKTNKPKSNRSPYVPVKRRLQPIASTTSDMILPTENIKELSTFLSNQTFSDLGLQPKILEAVTAYLTQQQHISSKIKNTTTTETETTIENNIKPTEIQALSIPNLINSTTKYQHFLIAAETGSGKTLAYLLPVIQQLMIDEQKHQIKRRLDHPRSIILVPTRELVQQVTKTCKSLSHVAKFRCIGIDRLSTTKLSQQLATGPVDMIISTPTTMQTLIKKHVISLADTKYMIMDEADSLFDAGWGDECKSLIHTIQKVNSTQQEKQQQNKKLNKNNKTNHQQEKIIIVSATLPKSVQSTLNQLFPTLLKITTPSLHKSLPNLKQSFVDLQRFKGNRQLALLEILKKNMVKDEKILIFCNTKKSVELLQHWLQSKNVPALALYKDALINREETLQRFSQKNNTNEDLHDDDDDDDERKGKGMDNLLISTDIASRGIDTTFVDHVILYDFPTSVVDYLHRVGRTARAGQVGKSTSLIGRKDRMMADRIKRSIREGTIMT